MLRRNAVGAAHAVGVARAQSPLKKGEDGLDVRSDVYQVGLLLFELIAGRSPFDTDGSVRGWLEAHLVGSPAELQPPAVPAALAQVVSTALAKRPEERWASAFDFARAIRHAASGKLTAAERAQLSTLGVGGTELLDRAELTALLAGMRPAAKVATDEAGRRPAGAGVLAAEAAPSESATAEPAAVEPLPAESEPATVELDVTPLAVAPPATALKAASLGKLSAPPEPLPPRPRPRYRGLVAGLVLALVFALGWLAARWIG